MNPDQACEVRASLGLQYKSPWGREQEGSPLMPSWPSFVFIREVKQHILPQTAIYHLSSTKTRANLLNTVFHFFFFLVCCFVFCSQSLSKGNKENIKEC